MDVVVSPYHLTGREAPAMAALLLAGTVYTYLPAPVKETRAGVGAAMEGSPGYLRLLRAWLPLGPLFECGVIKTLHGVDDPAVEVAAAAGRVEVEKAWEGLKGITPAVAATEMERLESESVDLLKGGPDPGISIPAGAGLDAFALARGMMVCRSGGAGSLAQQAEARLGESVFSVGVPFLRQASAALIVEARGMLKKEIGALGDAMRKAAGGDARPTQSSQTSAEAGKAVRAAGAEYAKAFKARLGARLQRDDESGRRVVEGFASIACRRLPADAMLISSVAALNRATGKRGVEGEAVGGGGRGLTALFVGVMDVGGI